MGTACRAEVAEEASVQAEMIVAPDRAKRVSTQHRGTHICRGGKAGVGPMATRDCSD